VTIRTARTPARVAGRTEGVTIGSSARGCLNVICRL
jgi:hypothetical protein